MSKRKQRRSFDSDYALQKPESRPLTDALKSVAERSGIADQAPPRSLPDPTGEEVVPDVDAFWRKHVRPWAHSNTHGHSYGEGPFVTITVSDRLTEEQTEVLANNGFKMVEDGKQFVAPATPLTRMISDKTYREINGEPLDAYRGVR